VAEGLITGLVVQSLQRSQSAWILRGATAGDAR
jgi:hypothetical protein